MFTYLFMLNITRQASSTFMQMRELSVTWEQWENSSRYNVWIQTTSIHVKRTNKYRSPFSYVYLHVCEYLHV